MDEMDDGRRCVGRFSGAGAAALGGDDRPGGRGPTAGESLVCHVMHDLATSADGKIWLATSSLLATRGTNGRPHEL